MTTIAEIKKRLEAATPGPWRRYFDDDFGDYGIGLKREIKEPEYAYRVGGINKSDDSKFIAHAPTDIAFLLEKLERFEKTKELIKIHYDSTTPMDEYFTGMYNGIECVLACIEDREPVFKTCERKGDDRKANQ